MILSNEQLKRYERQIIMDTIGKEGQEKLCSSKVLVIGTGGLGSPAALYLAAMGVGTLGFVDSDCVEISNLQRQIIHGTPDIGKPKVESARDRINQLNPHVKVEVYKTRLSRNNVMGIISKYDLVVDAVDNFPTRFLVNDACFFAGKPLVEAGVLRWEGQVMTIFPGEGACYRCLFKEPPLPENVEDPGEAGVLGVIPGIIGTLQALEAVKIILGRGKNLKGRMLIFDGLNSSFREIEVPKNPRCPLCGEEPKITSFEGK
ncbi:MAG TPA: adenylyltransferase [Peptococcaceae bacterium]|nr:MAG: Adenylyltransferase ThiF [Clostridia bacterium 41_269]HBT20123.1 adenylyltransferase [Peptococcaceae bacterium]